MNEKRELFSKAENKQGFLKMGIMGFPGSGKTFTATQVAIGLVTMLQDKRPVFFFDTESGFNYVVKKFDTVGIEVKVARTRAFVDLLEAVDLVEKEGSLLIIDSITHCWEDVQESYKKANQRQRLTFSDWGPLKTTWKRYTEKFLNSKVHIIMCGRAADTFDYFENPDDKKMELHKTGTKMQAEKNLGYEPGIAVEMERANVGDLKAGQRTIINRAYILKDRFDMLDGMVFDNPTFDTFLPHIKKLNIGVHEGLSGTNSTELFDKDSDKNWLEKKRQVEIFLEEIQNELVSAYPGQSSEEKKKKTDLIFQIFNTRSWANLQEFDPAKLKDGLEKLKSMIQKENNANSQIESKKISAS